MTLTLAHSEFFEIMTPTGTAIGGSQDWYPEERPRRAGCGPVAASNIMWYMSRLRPEWRRLCDVSSRDKPSFIRLMQEMYNYVTPGQRGVNTSAIFTDGAVRFGAAHGVTLTPRVLEIPELLRRRPSWDAVCDFISAALSENRPVAFLNLSNGALQNLENWHWVTIFALDAGAKTVSVSDQEKVLSIDLAKWLETTLLGGALVYLEAN